MHRLLNTAGAAAVVVLATALAILVRFLRRSRARATSPGHRAEAGTPPSRRFRDDESRPTVEPRAASDRAVRSPLTTSPMPSGVTLLLVPTATLVGVTLFITVGAPWLLTRQHFPTPPEQPIYFSHEVHVQQAGLDCAFCH